MTIVRTAELVDRRDEIERELIACRDISRKLFTEREDILREIERRAREARSR